MVSPDRAKSWIELFVSFGAVVGGFVTTVALGWRYLGRSYRAFLAAHSLSAHFGTRAGETLYNLLDSLELAAVEASARRNIVERHLQIGIYVCSRLGAITWVNEHFSASFGIDRDAATGFGWVSCIHSDDRDRVQEAWRRYAANDLPFSATCRVKNDRTNQVWVGQFRTIPLMRGDDIAGWVGCVEEVKQETGPPDATTSDDP